MPKIKINPYQIEFETTLNQTILEKGLEQQLNLAHACKDGICGACKTKVISGDVALDLHSPKALSDEEQRQGYTLLCKARAITDVTLDIPNILSGFTPKVMPAKIITITRTRFITILTLKLPANFEFYPGQYIEIMLKGRNRSYSIANSSKDLNKIELHIKYHEGGVLSEYVWNELTVGSVLRFRGPLGSFGLQNSQNPIICVCTGTGFAPIKSILENMYLENNQREIHFYWGNRQVDDFYLLNLLDKWQDKLNIKTTLCLSGDHHEKYYSGRVTSAIGEDFINLGNYEVYACGNANMIEDVFELTSEKGLIKQNFFSDVFTPSKV